MTHADAAVLCAPLTPAVPGDPSYDPARDGLRRVASIDTELLEQSGRPGPLDDFRHALPAHQQRGHILELVRRHQVVVISGETGELEGAPAEGAHSGAGAATPGGGDQWRDW